MEKMKNFINDFNVSGYPFPQIYRYEKEKKKKVDDFVLVNVMKHETIFANPPFILESLFMATN